MAGSTGRIAALPRASQRQVWAEGDDFVALLHQRQVAEFSRVRYALRRGKKCYTFGYTAKFFFIMHCKKILAPYANLKDFVSATSLICQFFIQKQGFGGGIEFA